MIKVTTRIVKREGFLIWLCGCWIGNRWQEFEDIDDDVVESKMKESLMMQGFDLDKVIWTKQKTL